MKNKEKKVLLVGSSFSAAPIFFALKKYDLHISVCGKVKSDPCHQYADASFFIDYSDSNELEKIIESESFDYLVPTCNDYSYMSCASLAKKHSFSGFDNYETASCLHTKNNFRQIVDRLNLPAPYYKVLQKNTDLNSLSDLKYPVLVKPIDSFSGRGMTKVEDVQQLEIAIKDAFEASRVDDWVVLEQFVEGHLYSHSAFIEGGKVKLDFFVDEFCTVYPYQVDCSNHPSTLKEFIKRNVRESIDRLVAELELVDGLLHTQFIAQDNDVWILETMRRSPGDLYGKLIELSTGVDYNDLFIRPYLGKKMPEIPLLEDQIRFYGRHTISVDKPLINFSFSENIPSVHTQYVPLKSSGERLDVAPYDKLAILFSEFEDANSMQKYVPELADYICIHKHGE